MSYTFKSVSHVSFHANFFTYWNCKMLECLLPIWMLSSVGRWAIRQDLWQGSKTQVTAGQITLPARNGIQLGSSDYKTLRNLPRSERNRMLTEPLSLLICPSPVLFPTFFTPRGNHKCVVFLGLFLVCPFCIDWLAILPKQNTVIFGCLGTWQKWNHNCVHSSVTCFPCWTLCPWEFHLSWFIHCHFIYRFPIHVEQWSFLFCSWWACELFLLQTVLLLYKHSFVWL